MTAASSLFPKASLADEQNYLGKDERDNKEKKQNHVRRRGHGKPDKKRKRERKNGAQKRHPFAMGGGMCGEIKALRANADQQREEEASGPPVFYGMTVIGKTQLKQEKSHTV